MSTPNLTSPMEGQESPPGHLQDTDGVGASRAGLASPSDDIEMQSEMRHRNQTAPPEAPGIERTPPQLRQPSGINANSDGNNDSFSLGKFFWGRFLNARYLFGSTSEESNNFNKKYGYEQIYKKVEDFPKGYPQCAAFLSSDDSFANYRQFKRLSARILLHLEIKLTDLEEELDALDKRDAANPIMKPRLRGFEGFPNWDTDQQSKVAEIQQKYLEYGDVLSKAAELHSLGGSAPRDYHSVFNWIRSRAPFGRGRFDFILHADDFVSLSRQSQQGRPFEDLLESSLGNMPRKFWKFLLQTQKESSMTKDKFVTHYSRSRLSLLANFIIVSLAVCVLFIPVYLLFLVPMSHTMMALVSSIFVFAFAGILTLVTDAKMQEVFVGSAAYAAVLVTFLGNLNNNGGSCQA